MLLMYQKLIKHSNARLVQSCLCSVHVLTFCQCWMLFFNLMGIELEVRLIVVVLCSVRDQFLTRSEEIGRVCILWTATPACPVPATVPPIARPATTAGHHGPLCAVCKPEYFRNRIGLCMLCGNGANVNHTMENLILLMLIRLSDSKCDVNDFASPRPKNVIGG
jgi:hypothetical protein